MTYSVLSSYVTRAVLILLLLAGLLSSQVQASHLILEQCEQGDMSLEHFLQFYKDEEANKTLFDIQQLTEQDWQPVNRTALASGFSRTAHWYRLTVENTSAQECQLWLDLNTLGVNDVQMFNQQAGESWQHLQAGVAYPFAQWSSAQRAPSLPLTLSANSTTQTLLRLHSNQAFAVTPQLLTRKSLVKQRMSQSLTHGTIFAVLGLLAVISLLIGYIYRLKVLLALASAALVYIAYLASIAGYAFIYLWPTAVQWNAQVVLGLHTAVAVLVLGYVRVFFQVKNQPQYVHILLYSAQLALLVSLVLRLALPSAQWLQPNTGFSILLQVWIIGVILVAIYSGLRNRLAYGWLGYTVLLGLLGHTTVLLLFSLGFSAVTPYQNVWQATSVCAVGLLLSYTLVSQIALGRRREVQALLAIEQLKGMEQEALEQRVERRTEQLREALQNQNMLLARISHDLRSPLQHVLRDARLLQETPAQAEQYGHSIQRAVHQQLDLIDELLEFSRGELKQQELLIAPGYFFGFLREIEESGVFLAEQQHNSFSSDLATDLPLLVNADFRRLRQVLINLLANSAKFTQQGRIQFAVSLRGLDKQAGYADVRFAIEDNGVGIPKEDLEGLLQPFQRGGGSAAHEGVGLGLYIVRQLLDAMNSQLQIEEPAGGGVLCHFTVRLALAAEQELEQVFVESYSASSAGQEHTVLIVDDVAIAQEMLYELLAGYGYNPIACSSAAEALVILRDHPVDIIITDQVMPVMDGWDLLRKVREEWPRLPMLLYSARPPVRPMDLAAAIEFDACLLKPVATSELLAQINRLAALNK